MAARGELPDDGTSEMEIPVKRQRPDSESDVLSLTVREFLAATAAKQPTPGGGSVAGVVGCLSAALARMAVNYTRGKKNFAQHAEVHERAAKHLSRAGDMFEELVSDDIQAYQLYVNASKLSPGPEKDQAVQLAIAAAIDVPRELAKVCLAELAELAELADKCNPQLMSDLKAAAALATAAVRLSDYNVRINATQLADRRQAEEIRLGSSSDLDRAGELLRRIENA